MPVEAHEEHTASVGAVDTRGSESLVRENAGDAVANGLVAERSLLDPPEPGAAAGIARRLKGASPSPGVRSTGGEQAADSGDEVGDEFVDTIADGVPSRRPGRRAAIRNPQREATGDSPARSAQAGGSGYGAPENIREESPVGAGSGADGPHAVETPRSPLGDMQAGRRVGAKGFFPRVGQYAHARSAAAARRVGLGTHATAMGARRSAAAAPHAATAASSAATTRAGTAAAASAGSAAATGAEAGTAAAAPVIAAMAVLAVAVLLLGAVFGGAAASQDEDGSGEGLAEFAIGEYEAGERSGTYHRGGKKYKEWYGMSADWCAMFVSYCAANCGIDADVFIRDALAWDWKSVMVSSKGAKAYSLPATTYTPQPGDIAVKPNHVGIVVSDNGDGTFDVVEGNTSPQIDPGDGAYHEYSTVRRKRYGKTSKWTHIVHPDYPAEPQGDGTIGPVKYDPNAKWDGYVVNNTCYGPGFGEAGGGTASGAQIEDKQDWGFARLGMSAFGAGGSWGLFGTLPGGKNLPYGSIVEVATTQKVGGKYRACRVVCIDCGRGGSGPPSASEGASSRGRRDMDFLYAPYQYLSGGGKASIAKLRYRVVSTGPGGYGKVTHSDMHLSSK